MSEGRGAHVPGLPAGSGSVAWKVNREIVLLLGWGRAILLQFGHPLVAAGVAEHSQFSAQPNGHWRRLQGTIDAFLRLAFGTPEEAREAAAQINAIHDRVHGILREAAGPFAAGTPYSAADPELLTWVHATLVDSFVRVYEGYVGPLSAAEQDRYCLEAAQVGPLLRIPDGQLPTTMAALRDYMEGMFASEQIVVTETARELGQALLAPSIPAAVWPAGLPARWLGRLVTIGQLPVALREAYGFGWSQQHEMLFQSWSAVVRMQVPLLPSRLRHWPVARQAARRAHLAEIA